MPQTAFAAKDYAVRDLWAGEVEDFAFDWDRRMKYSALASATYSPTATGASGSGWSAVGETAAAFDFYVPAGLTALASATAQFWSAFPMLTANGTTATASALTGVKSVVRLSATGAPGSYLVSARLKTSSGRELRDAFTARIQG